jgi:hypothetical protein
VTLTPDYQETALVLPDALKLTLLARNAFRLAHSWCGPRSSSTAGRSVFLREFLETKDRTSRYAARPWPSTP